MINVTKDKIQAIKALRTFTHETFGVTVGLKACKDFVELMELVRRTEIYDALREALKIVVAEGYPQDVDVIYYQETGRKVNS